MKDEFDPVLPNRTRYWNENGITRRAFIGSAIAVPVAANAKPFGDAPEILPEEPDLVFSQDGGILSVTIVQDLDPKRREFWQKLRVFETCPPPEHETQPITVWQIAMSRFGPEPQVRLRFTENNGLKRYTLTVERLTYGRVADRRMTFTFQQRRITDPEGTALLAKLKTKKGDYDLRTRKFLETLGDGVPRRKVFTIEVSTNFWSLTRNATAAQTFALEPDPDTVAQTVNGFLPLRTWINQEKSTLSQWVSAGRVTSTMRLIFNGQVGFERRHANRLTRLFLHRDLKWEVKTQTAKLWALTPDVTLSDLTLEWVPVKDPQAVEGPQNGTTPPPPTPASPTAEEQAETEDVGPGPKGLPDDIARAVRPFELVGTATLEDDVEQVTITAQRRDPGLQLHLNRSGATPQKVHFRVLNESDIEGGQLSPGMLRSEASLPAEWTKFSLTGGPDASAGPFQSLQGRLLERVDAPADMDRFDYARCEGNISFNANFTGPGSLHWRTMTPVGPISFRGFSPEDVDDSELPPTAPTSDGAFSPRRGDQVQIVFRWTGWRTSNPIFRNTPKADWAEVNGIMREAAVTIPDATTNRLMFAPTHLTILFAQGPIAPPLTSYIRLAPPKEAERAQFDLRDASLRASRSADLLSLVFRFQDFGLSFQGDTVELVRKNAACLLSPSPTSKGRPHDTRPVLVVDFPGQHMLEEAYFRPLPTDPPDVEVKVKDGSVEQPFARLTFDPNSEKSALNGESEPVYLSRTTEGGWTLDINDRVQIVEALRQMKSQQIRAKFRKEISDHKSKSTDLDAAAFREHAKSFADKLKDRELARLPEDQAIYIGQFAMDPDAMRLSARIWAKKHQDNIKTQIDELFQRVERTATAEINRAKNAKPPTPEDERIKTAAETFDGALALEQRLEALFPTYQLYRTSYRDVILEAFEGGRGKLGAIDLEGTHFEAIYAFRSEPTALPDWAAATGVTAKEFAARHARALEAFELAVSGSEDVDIPARARIAPPSRLAFRVRCRDGISVARTDVDTLDTPTDAPAELVRERLKLTLADMTRFSDFELSVTARSETVYRPSEAGRLDARSARRLDTSQAARLDHLGFTDGEWVTSDTRLGEIAKSLREKPTRYETAIEMARLTLSPDQNAVVVANDGVVPDGVFAVDKDRTLAPVATEVFTAQFLVDEVDPNLRAIHSPDLRPDVFESRVAKSASGKPFPGAAAPLRGPLAPWHIGPHQTQTQTLGEGDIDSISQNSLFKRLHDFLSGQAKKRKEVAKRDLRFRAPLDAYARHELVILSSAWGLPALGKRSESGALVEGASQAEVASRHRLVDVQTGSALYVPQTLGTVELSLSTLGLSLRHASSFSTPAAAFDTNRNPLFPALSVESWQQWTNLGRDIHCEVVYKGFLWPIGQRASLVQVTERTFFIDRRGAIRAVLRQRMFIRVGKADKIYPALKQPAQGRRFPVERLVNLTSKTPDIVDPSDMDFPPSFGAGGVLPNGRIQLGAGSQGLVFWPRAAKLESSNIRFELDLDGTKTDLPLIFVDNVAANHAATLGALTLYYNSLESPDPISADKKQKVFDPLQHLRTLNMGGGKRRYAPELETGSASVETMLWTLCATGLERGTTTVQNSNGLAQEVHRSDIDYQSDPLLQGADQPPFYPALECARIRPRQAERLVGRPLNDTAGKTKDPRFLRAMPDGRYVAFGLPSGQTRSQSAEGTLHQVMDGNEAEVYLAMIDRPALDMGDKGDNSGGVFRPSGRLVALSRTRGALTWHTDKLINFPKESGALPKNAADVKAEDLQKSCNALLSVAPLMSMVKESSLAVASETSQFKAMDICAPNESHLVSTELENGLKEAKKIYSDIFDGDAKILGLISIKDLFQFIKNLDPPSTGAPQLAEQIQYGAAGVQQAISDTQDTVDDALGAIEAAAEAARSEVIVPLSGAVAEIRDGWDDLDREIKEQTAKIPGGALSTISFKSVFPELHCTLVAFAAALKKSADASDALSFTLSTSEVFSSGRRFLDALFRAASDPGRRIAATVSAGIDQILDLFSGLDKNRAEILRIALGAFLGNDKAADGHIKNAVAIAQWLADGEGTDAPDVLDDYVTRMLQIFIPKDAAYDLVFFLEIPALPDNAQDALKFTPAQVREIAKRLMVGLIEGRGTVDLEDIFLQRAPSNGLLSSFFGARFGALDSNRSDPLIVAYARAGLEKVEDAEKVVNSASPPVAIPEELTRAKNFLSNAVDIWDNASNSPDFETEWRRILPELQAWVRAGFAEEWRFVRTNERLARKVIAAVNASDIPGALNATRDLVEFNFGPLDLSKLETLCIDVQTAIITKIAAILPPSGEMSDLQQRIKAHSDHINGWKTQINDIRASVEKSVIDSDKVLMDTGIKDQVVEKRDDLFKVTDSTTAALDAYIAVVDGFEKSLAEDNDRLDRIHQKIKSFASTPPACTPGKIKDLTEIAKDIGAFVEHRQMMVARLSTQLERLVVAFEALIEEIIDNDTLHFVTALAGIAKVVEAAIGGLPDGDNKKALERLKKEFDDHKESFEKTDDAYARDLAALCVQALTYLRAQVTNVRDKINSTPEIAAIVPESLEALNTQLNRAIGWLDGLIERFEGIAKPDSMEPLKDLVAVRVDNVPANTAPIDTFKGELRDWTVAQIVKIENQVVLALGAIEDQMEVFIRDALESLEKIANKALRDALEAGIGGQTLPSIYAGILKSRNDAYEQITQIGQNTVFAQNLLVKPEGREAVKYTPPKSKEVQYTPNKENPDTTSDQLAGDVAWLYYLLQNDLFGGAREDDGKLFIRTFLEEWSNLEPTPLRVAQKIASILREIVRGDIFAAIDFQFLRRQVEDYILSLVPTKTEMTYGYGVALGSEVRAATAGIFAPGEGTKLTIKTGISIDMTGAVRGGAPNVNATTTGALGPFDVKLVGDAFDALTLKFNGATFRAESGKKFEFDIEYSDYEIGPMLEFVQQFQSFLTPKGDSGFFLSPVTSPSFGIKAGYILNLGDFTVGAMAISNVGLATSAVLPFDDGEARFKASLSTRLSPFTITYLPYGGSGFFGIEANANGIVGFEASFEFGGSAVFAFGPLSGQGRLMSGFYIRMSVADNGQKLTELSATVFVGGSASIWIFSFSAALSVRLGMVNGDMSGEAIFSFSFSMGFSDFEYSITMFKQEAKGFNGQDSASLYDGPFGDSPLRFAQLGDYGRIPLEQLDKSKPRIDRTTVCQSRNWARYNTYFHDTTPEDPFA